MHILGRKRWCLQSTGSNGCASGCCSVPPKVPGVAAALSVDGCGLLMQLAHLHRLWRNFSRAFDPGRHGLGEGLGRAQPPCQAHLSQEPPWSCSSPSNKCLVNTCSTPLGHLLIILSPLQVTWHGFTPHPSFLMNNTQSPPSVSLPPTSVMAFHCVL